MHTPFALLGNLAFSGSYINIVFEILCKLLVLVRYLTFRLLKFERMSSTSEPRGRGRGRGRVRGNTIKNSSSLKQYRCKINQEF
ncbi:hypothetical protein BpHYR1_025978 [Brachionus plicatilis]|uniref:Uncharacterized protein n=1 Tax=Brachionus plicatilis TaxID=10195 RepID=A0A3M7P9J2_BRAPC|nr:hypothetical protein BpHYR1_025978 [Brachionus plicatilis]